MKHFNKYLNDRNIIAYWDRIIDAADMPSYTHHRSIASGWNYTEVEILLGARFKAWGTLWNQETYHPLITARGRY